MGKNISHSGIMIQILENRGESEHFHEDLEVLYVLEGKMEVTVNQVKTELGAEDVFLVNANMLHSLNGSEGTLCAYISMRYELMKEILNRQAIAYYCDSTKDDSSSYTELRRLIRRLLRQYLDVEEGLYGFGYHIACYQLMEYLSTHFLMDLSDGTDGEQGDKFKERLEQINSYIHQNYNKQINLKDLANQMYLSVGYLSRFFKKYYGSSFTDYLNGVRLTYGMDSLLYTNKRITEIAMDCGFPTIASFHKAFKKRYGEIPSAVRKRNTEKINKLSDWNHVEISQRLEKIIWNQQSGRKEDKSRIVCTCSASDTSPLVQNWNDTINIGEAQDLLPNEMQVHLMMLKSALNFKYVRFWSPFTPEMMIDINNPEHIFNFSRLDTVLDFLLQNNLIPHIEIMNKPKRLQKNSKMPIINRDREGAASLENWDLLIDAFMVHITERYGKSKISHWRIEVWSSESHWEDGNEYDDYFTIFQHTKEIIKKHSPGVCVGGCGMQAYSRGNDYPDLIKEFYTRWKERGCLPDFISFMSYAYYKDRYEAHSQFKRNTDSSFVVHGLNEVKKILKEISLDDIPVYITEWNHSVSDRNYLNDSCYKGAQILQSYFEVYGQTSVMAYFIGSDRYSEFYDTDTLLFGGAGLISRDGILKPSGFAFDFLNRLSPGFVAKDRNYMVTTDGESTVSILCHNAKELNYTYFNTEEDKIEKEHLERYYEDTESLQLQIQLTGLPDGGYQMKRYSINEQYGSVLDIWGNMEYEKRLSINDIKYFRRICEPHLSIHTCYVENGAITLEIELYANEISLIVLQKRKH